MPLTICSNSSISAGASKRSDSGGVSPPYLLAARNEGMSNPLTGFGDSRLSNPDTSLVQNSNWVKGDSDELGISLYLYRVGDRTVQFYAFDGSGKKAIGTFNWNDGSNGTVEHLVQSPDGRITRSTQEIDGDDPAALAAKKLRA